MHEKLKEGRELYRRRQWADAFEALLLADQHSPLGIEDLELLATSAYLIGRDDDFCNLLDRSHHMCLQADSPLRAARNAFWLGLTLMFRGEIGQANGWLARARRLVQDQSCVECGYLLLPEVERYLREERNEEAYNAAEEAVELGQDFDDADLIACGRHLQGRALIKQGRVKEGLAFLDDAMLAVVGDELSSIVTGLIYCSVIDACRQVFATSRAREWTRALAGWCDEQPQMVAFTGICHVHRAEILQLNGAWNEAMAEARRACDRFSRKADRDPPGAAYYRQGELHRLRGEFSAASKAFRDASRLGCDPQPGLALLRLAQGRTDEACVAMRRVLGILNDPLERANLLPAMVEISLAAGDIGGARNACSELEDISKRFETDILGAMVLHARGATELTAGEPQIALGLLRRAFEVWSQVGIPYEAARARLLIGKACRLLGDFEACELELVAARAEFDRLGAALAIASPDTPERSAEPVRRLGLTSREIEVLRLIASGETNKAIAVKLFLSERTIDRHVSNILNKLDVPSRAAATAYAYEHRLF